MLSHRLHANISFISNHRTQSIISNIYLSICLKQDRQSQKIHHRGDQWNHLNFLQHGQQKVYELAAFYLTSAKNPAQWLKDFRAAESKGAPLSSCSSTFQSEFVTVHLWMPGICCIYAKT